MTTRRMVIAGTGSGVGKTTLTIGLMAALRHKGLTVQGFKCGPDYIDPTYHTAVTGRPSRNLDSWMLSEETLYDVLAKGSDGADISVIEGVMGLYDGRDSTSNEGSTAHISQITNSPIVLVVDCKSMARSAAAIVKGFQQFAEDVQIVGVIANQVGSEHHFQLIQTAVEQECGLPVIGYLKREDDIEIPERSLGLIPSVERGELDDFFRRLGELVTETIDLNQLLELSKVNRLEHKASSLFVQQKEPIVRIAVAKDAAFHSYYIENFEILNSLGAELVYFSPLANEPLPDHIDGLYIGGGLPEEYARLLAKNQVTKQSIKRAIEQNLPTFAECGGFMYLAKAFETTDQESYEMVGVIPGTIQIQSQLKAIGYREISGHINNFMLQANEKARGHEYHYALFQADGEWPYAYETKGMRGLKKDGFLTDHLVAGFTQFHFASNPVVAQNFIHTCLSYRRDKNERSYKE